MLRFNNDFGIVRFGLGEGVQRMRSLVGGRTVPRRVGPAIALSLGMGLAGSGPAMAGGLLLYEVGTSDVGLASAGYGARSGDASTVLTNPAGMTRLQGKQFLLGTQGLYADLEFSRATGTSPALGTSNGGNPVGFVPGGSAFYTQQLNSKVSVGFGLAGYFGLAEKYDDNWVGRYYVRKAVLTGISLLPSIAYRVNDKFSVGASLNAMYGSIEQKVAINNITGPDGALKLDDNVWGWGGNLGLLYEIDPGTRIGLTYTSQVNLDFKANTEFSGVSGALETVLRDRGLFDAQVDLGIKVPQTLMLSVFHQIDPQWAVLASAGWQDWSSFGEVEVSVDSSDPTSLTTDLPFQDTWHAALGGQYQLSEPWRLNFGIAYDSDLYKTSTVSPVLPGGAAWRFGFGGENQVSQSFHWGVAAEYIWGGTLDVNVQSAASVAIGGRGDVVGSYKDTQTFVFSANFGWNF